MFVLSLFYRGCTNNHIQTRLMSPPAPLRPYYDTVEHLLDVGLYSDVLVSIYRWDPQNAILRGSGIVEDEAEARFYTRAKCNKSPAWGPCKLLRVGHGATARGLLLEGNL